MTFTMTEKFYLYDEATDKFLVELLFGEKVWLQEGELDSVPRNWIFTEKEIIEKFGEESLKYKMTVDGFKARQIMRELNNRTFFYAIDDLYYQKFEHAKFRLQSTISVSSEEDEIQKFVIEELDKIESIIGTDIEITKVFANLDTVVMIQTIYSRNHSVSLRISVDSSDNSTFYELHARAFID